jgi:hypothetical protein
MHITCVCFSLLLNPRSDDTFQTVYIKSHTRASSYFVGIAVGFLLYHLRDCKQKVGVVSFSADLLLHYTGTLFYLSAVDSHYETYVQ